MAAADARLVRFGVFEVDLVTGELRKKGVKIALQEQPFQVLAMLLAKPGELVTREELRKRLWPDAVFVDFDHGLNKAVGKIRRTLGDLANSPRFLETLERRGYRFIAPVEHLAAAPTQGPSIPATRVVRLIWGERTIALAEGSHLIGRDPAAEIWIDSPLVSRRHAMLLVDPAAVTLQDLGSHNGTFVNDQRVEGRRVLAHAECVRVGPARLTLHMPQAGRTITDPAAY